jgi:hypothetical protein
MPGFREPRRISKARALAWFSSPLVDRLPAHPGSSVSVSGRSGPLSAVRCRMMQYLGTARHRARKQSLALQVHIATKRLASPGLNTKLGERKVLSIPVHGNRNLSAG